MAWRLIAVRFLILAAGLPLTVASASAADRVSADSSPITGLYLTTQYPTLTVRVGETATIDLSLRNYRLPPQQLVLSVPEAAAGWKATILGGGQPVGSAIVTPDGEERLQLRLEPAANA